ncbi:Arc family DNA-binding protein [Rhizobium leguminosarum]|nr:Arc family DNA-binding protein [Rhizobium ruizarguesonis]NEJ60278.1 Arc family DNA-binding protein [Rhizobium ruizarguesonis]NEJ67354.1 Arc family DNA-binding protein [Rhizobium ruizarguesonis]NEK04302.1 Arc family DNA-binding protein [Rhizobium ruizarguesonis]
MSDDPVREQDKFMLRLPAGLRERIKEAATRNGRSMNAEIVSTLEVAYPPKTIDIENLTDFLSSLASEAPHEERLAYIDQVNEAMAKMKEPWTVHVDPLGEVTFLPYATQKTTDDPHKG